MKSSFATLVLVILSITISSVYSHSYVTMPITRSNQRSTTSGCRPPACPGPCDAPKDRGGNTAPLSIARGAPITVQWPRNNHPGGFIRLSWAAFALSDTQAAFDAGAQHYSCHEVNCGPSNPADPNGGDTGPADGSITPCTASITVPTYLTDGEWTLQWAWFGGGFALADYYSCIDYNVAGGPTGTQTDPIFVGGDYANPGQAVCKWFSANSLHVCTNEPCPNPPAAGMHAGPPNMTNVVIQNTGFTPPPSPATTSTPQTATSTSSGSTSSSTSSSGSSGISGATSGRVFIPDEQAPTQGMCPNPNAPNIDSTVLYPPICGSNAPQARCPDGQCCSSLGYCGPIPDPDGQYRSVVNGIITVITYDEALEGYCTNNQGDWSFISCDSVCRVGAHLCNCTNGGGCDPDFECGDDLLCHDPNIANSLVFSFAWLFIMLAFTF